MEEVKKTDSYTIFKKRNGRYGVKNAGGKWIGGEEKISILQAQGLIKSAPKKAEPVSEEAPAAESSEETPVAEA